MRKMKKLLSVILMLGLVLSLSPQAFANESTVAEEHDLSALSLDEQAEYYLAQDENDGEIALMSIAEDDIMLLSNANSSEIVFKISSVEQLLDLANKVNSSAGYWGGKWADAAYEQVSDIDLSGIVWPCIGVAYNDYGALFRGKYNGNGHKISNVYTETSGLFGGTNGATIENLAVVNCDVGNANHFTGAIVGKAKNTVIRNCWTEGKVTTTAFGGGIAGYAKGESKIENCYSLCEINEASFSGGIAGAVDNTEIKNCVALSKQITDYENNIKMYRISEETATLSNNYAWAGMKLNYSTVTSNDAASGNGADLTYTENGLDKQFSEIFKNSDAWIFADNCLPVLKGSGDTTQALPEYITNINPGSTTKPTKFQGSGTEEDPYLIQNKADLILLSDKVNSGESYPNKHFKQTANIDLSGVDWTPIGKSSSQAFYGFYDGDGHEIANMTVNTSNNAGLFGYAGCSVRNLAIVNCNIKSSGAYIGAIAGHAEYIENCYATGTIEISGTSENYVGGIAGARSGVVKGCYSTVKIMADSDSNTAKSSGIVGAAYIVRNCVALNSELNAETAKRISCEELSTKENNYALQSMKVNGAEVTTDKGANQANGADLIIKDGKLYKDDGTEFTWSGFDTNIWTLPTEKGELPRLKYSSKVSLNLNEQAQTEVRVNTTPQSYDYDGYEQKFVIKDLYPSSINVYTVNVEYKASGTNDSYTINRPIDAKSYDVRLSYEGGGGICAYEKEIPNGLTIKQADNEIDWFYFSSSWAYGEAAKDPTAGAQFGEVEFVYSADGQNWTAEQPTNAGSYQIKAYVTETNNYKGAEEIKHFTINQATPTISENPTSSKISRNKTLSQSKLTGGKVLGLNNSELSGVWTWRDGTEKMSKLGKFAKTVVFTPEDKNYTEIETDIEVTVYDSSIAGGSNDNCTVSFDTGLVQTVAKNGFAAKPADPQKEGYTFNGWYTDQKYTKKFNFNTPISDDLTLYAKWTKTEASADKQIIMTIGEKSAAVFGKTVHNDVAPVIVNGRTMLPARFVAEALGAKVYWNEETKGVTIIGEIDGKAVNMLITIDSTTAYLNGEKIELDSAAFITDSRTYLPLRFICESLSAEVEWLKDTQKIIITAK